MTDLDLPAQFAQQVFSTCRVERCACWVASAGEMDEAVSIAKAIAKPNPCHVVLCLDSPLRVSTRDVASDGIASGLESKGPVTPEVIGKATAMLRYLYGSDTNVMVLPGAPQREIRRYVRNHKIDLVVMGSQALAVEREYGESLLDDPPCRVLVFVDPNHNSQDDQNNHTPAADEKDPQLLEAIERKERS